MQLTFVLLRARALARDEINVLDKFRENFPRKKTDLRARTEEEIKSWGNLKIPLDIFSGKT